MICRPLFRKVHPQDDKILLYRGDSPQPDRRAPLEHTVPEGSVIDAQGRNQR